MQEVLYWQMTSYWWFPMVLEDNYSSSPPVVSKNSTTANASSIKASSVCEGARAVSGGRRKYKSRFTCPHRISTENMGNISTNIILQPIRYSMNKLNNWIFKNRDPFLIYIYICLYKSVYIHKLWINIFFCWTGLLKRKCGWHFWRDILLWQLYLWAALL